MVGHGVAWDVGAVNQFLTICLLFVQTVHATLGVRVAHSISRRHGSADQPRASGARVAIAGAACRSVTAGRLEHPRKNTLLGLDRIRGGPFAAPRTRASGLQSHRLSRNVQPYSSAGPPSAGAAAKQFLSNHFLFVQTVHATLGVRAAHFGSASTRRIRPGRGGASASRERRADPAALARGERASRARPPASGLDPFCFRLNHSRSG
jgi:hypothetical protein